MATDAPSPTRRPVDLGIVRRFLAEHDIAIVGSSRDPKQFANTVHRHLRSKGHRIHPVHPHADEIEGDACVASVGELPAEVRAVLVMVNAEAAAGVVEQCIESGIDVVWLHRGAGPGAASQEAIDACDEAGLAVVAGACPMMFVEPVGFVHRMHRFVARRRLHDPS